jgi:alkylation response protein AidB-like acyl-CoA dehydrogenase
MYSFEPSDEQKMLVEAVSRYAANDLRPKAREAEEESSLPAGLVEKGWELGLLQASIPEKYGGFGEYSALTGVLAVEEMAYGDMAGALAVMTPALFALPILLAGSEEQKQTYLPLVIEGEWQPYTAAMIEPKFNYDPQDLATTAIENDDHYLIDGEKSYVPYAPQAAGMIVYANLDGKSQAFILPPGVEGVEVGERQKLLGLNAMPVYSVKFNQVKVSKANRLGGLQGHALEPILDATWLALAALGLGVSRAAFNYARDYAKEREVFGVKVAQKQAIAFMLAEMATEIEAIRLLTWEAAWMVDNGKEERSKQAYLAHLGAADMAMMVTDRAVQILGGHGYIREHPVELWMRNGRGIATLTGLAVL